MPLKQKKAEKRCVFPPNLGWDMRTNCSILPKLDKYQVFLHIFLHFRKNYTLKSMVSLAMPYF